MDAMLRVLNAGFRLSNIKPNTKYRLSYYVRTQDIQGKGGVGAYLSFVEKKYSRGLPSVRITGTHPWHRLIFEFTTPPEMDMSKIEKPGIPSIGLWAWFAEGEVWFDQVELVEMK